MGEILLNPLGGGGVHICKKTYTNCTYDITLPLLSMDSNLRRCSLGLIRFRLLATCKLTNNGIQKWCTDVPPDPHIDGRNLIVYTRCEHNYIERFVIILCNLVFRTFVD